MILYKYFNIIGWLRHSISIIFLQCLISVVVNASSENHVATQTHDEYYEDLYIKPLQDGKLFTQFQFRTLYRKDFKSLRWENKLQIFPLSLADLVSATDLNKLHFSLTKGNWNYRNWGYSSRSSPPGSQIRVEFSRHNESQDRSWKRLINSLAGKFCASLSSADTKTLVASKLAFNSLYKSPNSSNHVIYANLPEETFCTENLTPWKKLLPCYSTSGLASLLNAVNLFKSSYSSLAIDLEPAHCSEIDNTIVEGCEKVQLIQTISVIFNPPQLFEGKQTWSLAKIFGNSIQRRCPTSLHSLVHVDITRLDDKSKLYPKSYQEIRSNSQTVAVFDVHALLSNSSQVNLGIKQNRLFKQSPVSSRSNVPVHFRTHVAGVGNADGTIVATVTNRLDTPVRITYMDVLPHFLNIYLHTLTIRTKSGQELKPDKLNFILSRDRTPTLIEFSVVVPTASEVQISYDFERAFLRWTDYKPDANKGVLLGSAVVSVSLPSAFNYYVFQNYSLIDEDLKLYARPLLVILPTPDFSMPYNVICLVCSVLAAAFGPIHSMTTNKSVIKIKKQSLSKKGDNEQDEAESESKKDQ